MDTQSVLAAVGSWSVEDRLRLMEGIWAGLLGQGYDPALTAEQTAEVERRLAEDDAAPDDVVTWDEVKAAALKRAGR